MGGCFVGPGAWVVVCRWGVLHGLFGAQGHPQAQPQNANPSGLEKLAWALFGVKVGQSKAKQSKVNLK